MIVVGLLLIALVCLALGLKLPSSAWLIASLIATGGAGVLLGRARAIIKQQTAIGARTVTEPGPDATVEPDEAAATADAVSSAAEAAPSMPVRQLGSVPAPDEVWVIDGRPRYHLGDCAIIQGQDAEPIPFEQATEDGFMPCSLCEPQMAHSTH
jgi:hypothetical protein